MVSNAGIPPNSEIFNTYGETLTNAQLLNQYGFILDINENDRLQWSVKEILDDCFPNLVFQETDEVDILLTWHAILKVFSQQPHAFEHSVLVYYETNDEKSLCLNDEGKVSSQLLAFLLAMLSRHSCATKDEQLLRTTLDLLIALEASSLGSEETSNSDQPDLNLDPASSLILLKVSRFVVNLCIERKRRSGKPGSCEWNLSDLLEVMEDLYSSCSMH